jgi:hypothetical protein
MATPLTVESLAGSLVLGSVLDAIARTYGSYELLAHWTQGEFHHDLVLRLPDVAARDLGGRVLVVETNCNGGVKEVLAFDEVPDRRALWHDRCPDAPEFEGRLAPVKARARTSHWFDPCELLTPDTRSELREEHRRRQEGGGWEPLVAPSSTVCGAGVARKG